MYVDIVCRHWRPTAADLLLRMRSLSLTAASIVLVVLCVTSRPCDSMPRDSGHVCGEHLTELLKLACGGIYNSRTPIGKRGAAMDNAGVAEQCCTRMCSFQELQAYCGNKDTASDLSTQSPLNIQSNLVQSAKAQNTGLLFGRPTTPSPAQRSRVGEAKTQHGSYFILPQQQQQEGSMANTQSGFAADDYLNYLEFYEDTNLWQH